MSKTLEERRKIAYELEQQVIEPLRELVDLAANILQGTGDIWKRADSYWLGHLSNGLDGRGWMVTPMDTLAELRKEDDESEDD